MDLSGKTIIVTGASSGIGLATARLLSQFGANVALAARRSDRLAEVAADMPTERTITVPTDISEPRQCEALVSQVRERFDRIDGLVANAGTAEMGAMDEVSPDAFRKVIEVNATGTYETIRAAWSALGESGGSVVATSSVSGIGGDFGGFAYNASKGAVNNMVRGLALDYARSGVRVNAVAPSFTRTEMTTGLQDKQAKYDAMVARIPMGRPGEPEEVASVIAFLLSSHARFVNGVILPVDGGLNASNGQAPV